MSLRAQPSPLSPESPLSAACPDHHALRSGRSLLARVSHGVRLAQGGMFEQTAALLDEAHRRLLGHPVAESATVMPGVLLNLGLAQTLCGRFPQAEEHLREARSLARERRLPLMGLVIDQNLGCLSLYRGDAPAAIATFHGLTDRLPSERREALHVDLAEALLAEGLVEEAATALADGPWAGGSSANALLVEAKLRLLRGDHRHTVELTRRVRHSFGTGSLWYRLATRLERMALREGRTTSPVARARNALAVRAPLAAPRSSGKGAAHLALDILDAHARLAPGPWLAGAVSDPHVVRAGLESALRAGEAATALEWAELARTWAAPHVPGPGVRTPATASLADRYRAALVRGRDPHVLARRLESARWQAHHQTPGARRTPAPAPVAGALLERLDDRAFVRYTRADGKAVALVAAAGRVHARVLGPLPRVARAMARFVHPVAFAQEGCEAREAAEDAARVLLEPLLALVGDLPLVVAGDSYLGDPPWGMLPALRGRPLNLVPGAGFWLDRTRSGVPVPRPPERVLLVAAPEPDGAAREVAELADVYPGARVLRADRALRSDVLSALGRADLVHLAGHGRVPGRSPMLASVGLGDGPLLACDLAGLAETPDTVVLSTCWSGRGFADRAGAPLGFTGALLAAGVRTVVASPVPVRDAGTAGAMRLFHRALAAGVPAPEAVAVHLGRTGFCCFGA
ncbi:CHAT domain-containing protein [Nocardiopsis sp. CNS-639]|uniref:CHAT domain-containing protein n=1 Tax=Nocardiopsis sp. CNS-639 TaxID=1169153 RepID=UPI00036F067C|nr:CHAT domain-containing protein [Nocardiopsis sp. CNS-639]